MKRRPYPGVYNAGPVVNAGASVRDLLDGMETCNSDCALFLTLRRTPDDISSFWIHSMSHSATQTAFN